MLKNNREYVSTKKKVRKLQDALKIADTTTMEMPDFIFDAMISGIKSQIEDMKIEIREYEQLAGLNAIPVESIENIGQMLIKARIAHRYSQKDLATRVGVSPQQIQKYEADEYQSTDLRKIAEISSSLDLNLEGIGLLKGNKQKWGINSGMDTFSFTQENITVKNVKRSSWITTQREDKAYNFNKVA